MKGIGVKMKKIIVAMALATTLTTAVSTSAEAATYYHTKLADANGKKYNVSIKSSNAKKRITTTDDMWAGTYEGDIRYIGTFQFYVNGKKTAYQTKVDYNKMQKNFYKVSTKKGTPSLIAISERVATDADYVKLYYIYKGKLKASKSVFMTTLKPKYVKKNIIKYAVYSNADDFGYTVHYMKLSPSTGKLKVFKSKYIGPKRPW